MTNVTIIGTGTMGKAIAGLVTKAGGTAQTLGSTDTDQAVTGDIVVLAVPYSALADIVATRGASLAGKIVVDITNPVDFATFDSLVVPSDSSATAELASALPEAPRAQGVQHHVRRNPGRRDGRRPHHHGADRR